MNGASAKGRRALAALGLLLALGGVLAYVAEGSRQVHRTARSTPARGRNSAAPGAVTHIQELPATAVEGTPPTPPRAKLADAYFGDIRIVGHARDRDGAGISSLRIECHPAGFEPETAAQATRLATESGADGHFSFARFPRAQMYLLRAMGPGWFGELNVEYENVGRRHLIVVERLYYERYDFVDPLGKPVDVRGQIRLAKGRVVATSSAPHRPTQYARLVAMGFDFLGLPSNAFVSVHKGRAIFASDQSATHTVRIAGYEPVRLAMFRWPASRWPEARRVTLTPSAGGSRSVRYSVVFPRDRPPEWNVRVDGQEVPGPPYLSVDVHEIRDQRRHSVSARQPWFWAPAGIRLGVFVHGVEIPHTTIASEAGGVQIRPKYPDFAAVTLSYAVPEIGGEKQFSVHIQAERRGTYHRAWSARPGEARFRALPVGEYRFRRVWFSATERRFVSDVFGPVVLVRGHNKLSWK